MFFLDLALGCFSLSEYFLPADQDDSIFVIVRKMSAGLRKGGGYWVEAGLAWHGMAYM